MRKRERENLGAICITVEHMQPTPWSGVLWEWYLCHSNGAHLLLKLFQCLIELVEELWIEEALSTLLQQAMLLQYRL